MISATTYIAIYATSILTVLFLAALLWRRPEKSDTKTKCKRAYAVGLVTDGQGRVLVRRRTNRFMNDGNPYWDLPGGKIEVCESIEQAVAREVHEETGLTVLKAELLTVRDDTRYNEFAGVLFLYIVKTSGQISDEPGKQPWQWIPIEEAVRDGGTVLAGWGLDASYLSPVCTPVAFDAFTYVAFEYARKAS